MWKRPWALRAWIHSIVVKQEQTNHWMPHENYPRATWILLLTTTTSEGSATFILCSRWDNDLELLSPWFFINVQGCTTSHKWSLQCPFWRECAPRIVKLTTKNAIFFLHTSTRKRQLASIFPSLFLCCVYRRLIDNAHKWREMVTAKTGYEINSSITKAKGRVLHQEDF